MSYLIDGHNLIPKLGISLGDPQAETELIERLQFYCRVRKTQVEIYFDGGIAGQPALRKYGSVQAHFIRKGNIADAAIESRLLKLGKSARNWSVVSSDQRVQSAAREVHAKVISSDEFARLLTEARMEESIQEKTDTVLNPDEISEWLDIFNARNNE